MRLIPKLSQSTAWRAGHKSTSSDYDRVMRAVAADPALRRARWRLLVTIVAAVEPLMALLGLVWLLLLVIDFAGRRTGATALATNVIWGVFIADFVAEFTVAPRKWLYLKRHWIVALSLALPALGIARFIRITRVARAARSVRGVRLLRTLTSLNRAMASLRATLRRRGFGYVCALTVLVSLAGAAAMYAFENGVNDPAGIHDFPTALWWTAMIMTTMGSAYWPQTAEGRVLCVLLALYAFTMFGYVTAALATVFLNRDAERADAPLAGEQAIEALRQEVAALRQVLTDRGRPSNG
jgi:voltage-gated potassium channel